MNNDTYRSLLAFVEVMSTQLQDLNLKAINLVQSKGAIEAIKAIQSTTELYKPDVYRTADALQKSFSKLNLPTLEFAKNLQAVASQYSALLGSYDYSALAESARIVLEQSQPTTILQLATSYKTEMIHDAISCIVNANYGYLPNILNQTMQKPQIGAADVAFLKTGVIIPVIESELVYPRGFKTSLKTLNKTTAEDIADNGDIQYDTKCHKFLYSDSDVDSKGLNIVCAGVELLHDEFSETELINFVSYLFKTPMLGMFADTGKRIFDWLRNMFDLQENTVGFDLELYYHCRSREKGTMPYTFDEMMKAPYGLSGAGRFNQVGRSHFYFSSTKDGAKAEVKKHVKGDVILQTIKLKPVKGIKLLDLSGSLRRGAAFLKMIGYSLGDDTNKMPKEYLLPCFVADCCQRIGYDGIKYYGSKDYNNYVSWSDGYFEDAGMCVE